MSAKNLQTTSLCCSSATCVHLQYYISSLNLYQVWENQTNISILFIFLSCKCITWKLYSVRKDNTCTNKTTALLQDMCLFSLGAVYELRLVKCSSKLCSKRHHILIRRLLGHVTCSGRGMHSQTTPNILNARVQQPTVSKQKFDHSILYMYIWPWRPL